MAGDLLRERPECAERGWAPEMEPNRVCVTAEIAGTPLSSQLASRAGSLSAREAGPTARDDAGNILVHFARLPEVERRGCWYYHADREAWSWIVSGGASGIDRRPFPFCDALLMDLVSSSTDDGFGPAHVARVTDEIRLRVPGECSSPLWAPFPSAGSHDDCGIPGDTGINEDGSLVITWHPEHLPPDYAVCWALPHDSDVWEVYYEIEDEEESV